VPIRLFSAARYSHIQLGDDRMGKRLGTLAPSLLDRAAGKAKQRGRHAGRLSVAKRHGLRKSLKKLCFDVEFLCGLYRPRAAKVYRTQCKTLEKSPWPGPRRGGDEASGFVAGQHQSAGPDKAGGRADAMK